jgi:glycosyltransferase involved in cell wall biosynthesis
MDILPKITIITVVKNSVNTIEKAIQSVVKQNYPNLEYIILDGNSTDGTLEIIKKYNKEISFCQSKDDKGASEAYNEAIELSSGEIIGYLNADDFYEDGLLLKAGRLFKNNIDLEVLSFGFRVVELKDAQYITKSQSNILDIELDKNKDCSCLGINAKFFKKNLFSKYGLPLKNLVENQLFLSNDIELLIRLILNNVTSLAVNEIGYNYLSSDNSSSFSNGYKNNVIYMEDKVLIANRFLSDEFNHLLNPLWEKKFKKWIKKYRAKLVKQFIKTRKFNDAKKHFILGIKENNQVLFLLYLIKTFIRN